LLLGFFIILACQFLGDVLAVSIDIPIPGPVLGLIILFFGLLVCGGASKELQKVSQTLLKNMGVLFVPAGAGISLFFALILEQWDIILVASVLSTVVTLIVVALVFLLLSEDA
jgi:holin-like protein